MLSSAAKRDFHDKRKNGNEFHHIITLITDFLKSSPVNCAVRFSGTGYCSFNKMKGFQHSQTFVIQLGYVLKFI
jgi:hypothetical protein